MILKQSAVAGTFESSDVLVRIEPCDDGIHIKLQSSVMEQYGEQIHETVLSVFHSLEVENARIVLVDKGALDCTIKARVETAVFRACGISENIPWGVRL